MKEAEIDTLAMPWVNERVAHLLLVHRIMTIKVGDGILEESDQDSYDQVMFTQTIETIELVKGGEPILENVLTSWYKPYRWKMALCYRASQYKTHTWS